MDNYVKTKRKPAISLLKTELATRETASYLAEFYTTLPNPDPILKKAGIYIQTLREIRRDTRVSSATRSRKSGTFKRNSQLVSNGASDATVAFIEDVFKRINIRTVISEILDYFGYGYQVSEIIWGVDGTDIIPVKIQSKPQEWFKFSPDNFLLFCPASGDPAPVEPYKFLLTQNEADYTNPYGVGAYSDCFWPVTFKKGGVKFWARFIEKFGMPHVTGKLPRGTTQTDQEKLLEQLMLMIQNSVSVIPDDASVEIKEAEKASSTNAYQTFNNYHNAEISIAILGHEGTTASTPGRLGNDEAAMQARDDLIDADCANVAGSVNTLIRWILELNPHRASDNYPLYDIFEDETVDKTLAERDQILSNTGIQFTREYYRRMYNLSDNDFEIKPAAPQQTAQFAAPHSPLPTPHSALPTPNSPSAPQLIIDRAQTEITQDSMIDTIREMAESAESLEQFQAMLLDAFKDIDEKPNAQQIQQALTTAELAGRMDITTETGNQ